MDRNIYADSTLEILEYKATVRLQCNRTIVSVWKEIKYCFYSSPHILPLPHICRNGSNVRPHPHQGIKLLQAG